ncbi:MAG: hypothetical protein RL681_565 [Candidatus Parcubacteria bacterium]|jgi:peptidoglycan hydrolase-like protein with peptidoglycan-binding domain
MKKTVIVAMLASLVLQGAPIGALAQTTSTSSSALQSQIQTLLAQIKTLNDQLANIQKQKQDIAVQLVTSLREGSQGDQVQILQALLAADAELYPEGLITGFFGKATARAVARFQKKYGLEQVGFVGPRTLKKLNELLQKDQLSFEDDDSGRIAAQLDKAMNKDAKDALKSIRKICAKIQPGHTIAPGWLRKHDGAKPLVPLCKNLPPGIINNPNASSTPTSTPDTAAPVIANIVATPSYNSAAVSWTTNEFSDSQVAYGTSTTYGSLTTLNSTLVASHAAQLNGLSPNTLYHYRVSSKDASGNLATSTDQAFTTLVAPDTTAPFISSVVITPSSTSANISWTTNEAATSKVFYGTFSPVDPNATSTLVVSDSAPVTTHSLNLPSLAATTTYNFIVESVDAAANKATSSGSFVTMP